MGTPVGQGALAHRTHIVPGNSIRAPGSPSNFAQASLHSGALRPTTAATMRTIHIKRQLNAPIERVFELLSDHAGYTRFPGVRAAQLTRMGREERNGVGAVREITLGGAWFEEEITAFARPHRLGYRILRSRPPIEHPGGLITLSANAQGCMAEWTSTFRITVPLIGGLLTRIAAKQMSRGFAAVLKQAEQIAQGEAEAA